MPQTMPKPELRAQSVQGWRAFMSVRVQARAGRPRGATRVASDAHHHFFTACGTPGAGPRRGPCLCAEPGPDDIDPYLVGLHSVRWDTAEHVAQCRSGSWPDPRERLRSSQHLRTGVCSCGIYLLADREAAYRYAGDSATPRIVASALGWGYVVEHEDGWCCEYVRLTHLEVTAVVPTPEPLLAAVTAALAAC